jgi:hypothetical protein
MPKKATRDSKAAQLKRELDERRAASPADFDRAVRNVRRFPPLPMTLGWAEPAEWTTGRKPVISDPVQ